MPGVYGYSILNWLYGLFYFLAGYSPFLIILLNSTATCLSAWMVYLIVFRITNHRTAASLAMGLNIFWPSQILWSVNLLKEPILTFLLTVIIYFFVDAVVRKRWHNFLFIGLLWYPMGQIRVYTHWLILSTLALSLLLCIPRRATIRIVLLGFVLLAFLFKAGPSRIQNMYANFQEKIISTQIGFFTTGGSFYRF
ncbi:MAG TPA: glycosyltransferase family 39 protein, partial [archaeon]|nr:glycosyltransferase family 39 protein [archaeon]